MLKRITKFFIDRPKVKVVRSAKIIGLIVLVLGVVALTRIVRQISSVSSEHPLPIPVGQFAQDTHPAEEQATSLEEIQAEFSGIVEKYVAEVSKKNDGVFVIRDEVLGKTWLLKLVRIHEEKIVSLGKNQYFACADLDELKGGEKLDLDFYVDGAPDRKVKEVLIHKVNGVPRYTYGENNERVPVESGKSGKTSDQCENGLKVGDQAPDFSLPSLDGKEVKLSTYKGGVILLWFTNLCPGCQAVLPQMVNANKRYANKGVTFLAVSLLGDDTQTVRAVVRKHNVTFLFLIDPKAEVYERYGGVKVPPGTCPTNPQLFILNRGKVGYLTHFPGTPEADLWKAVDELISPGEREVPKEHPEEHPR